MFSKHIQTKSNNVLTELFKRYSKEKKQTVKLWVIHDRLSLFRFSIEYPSIADLLQIFDTRFSRNCGPPFGNPAHAIP